MTIEETIKRLEIIATNLCGQSAQNPNLWPDYKAVDVAISALRQQDVTDKDVGKNEPLTNAQKIRSMTDEELVNLHYGSSAHCIASDPTVCDRHGFIGNLTPCEQCYLKWLQQPAEEDDHA